MNLLMSVGVALVLLPTARTQARSDQRVPKEAEGSRAALKSVSATSGEVAIHRRDPFLPLINLRKPGAAENLPPGKAGLVISTLRVEGTVQGPNGMIAVVSNPQESVYFVREGDQLYDGKVNKITLDGVVFAQAAKDAFGKSIERTVMRRVYPTAGEQQ